MPTNTTHLPFSSPSPSASSITDHYWSSNHATQSTNLTSSMRTDALLRQHQLSQPPSPLSATSPMAPPTPLLKPRSPYISSRQISMSSKPIALPQPSTKAQGSSDRPSSVHSSGSALADVLMTGDVVGEGQYLQGELVQFVSSTPGTQGQNDYEPAKEFEVVKRLGTGSYAVVYLVREVLSRPRPISLFGDGFAGGMDDEEGSSSHFGSHIEYGKEYAIKCLSKANLDEEALANQMSEVTIHQSLRPHPNIVTLHRTLETPSFLLLILEYVPGEDLYYFLEQARDHYDTNTASSGDSPSSAGLPSSPTSGHTPPTPSLLANLHPSQLLSYTRLRLIASMFAQMCEAVGACHEQGVFHRDIKPENFIVTDGWTDEDASGKRERKVVVKLTDFGLSTREVESSDMDCGSAPYMSYECRNNIAPTYRPRAADVWSLGIVLINMLYHYNPWTDTTAGLCSSFTTYRTQPFAFFMTRFPGMTKPVAEQLAGHVFNILPVDSNDDSSRIEARALGAWIKDLPTLLGSTGTAGHKRVISTSSINAHPISTVGVAPSHRPCSRNPSVCGTPVMRNSTPLLPARSLSRAPPMPQVGGYEEELSVVLDAEEGDGVLEEGGEVGEGLGSRSASNNTKRGRKRGSRKRKDSSLPPPSSLPNSPLPPTPALLTDKDETLEVLATASQELVREISKASRPSSKAPSSYPASNTAPPSIMSTTSRGSTSRASTRTSNSTSTSNTNRTRNHSPPSMWPIPHALTASGSPTSKPPPKPLAPRSQKSSSSLSKSSSTPSLNKKPSLWRLTFGKNTSVTSIEEGAPAPPVPSLPNDSPTSTRRNGEKEMSGTAANVTNLIMGLNPQPVQKKTVDSSNGDEPWARGRQPRGHVYGSPPAATSPHASIERWAAATNGASSDTRNGSPTRGRQPMGQFSTSSIPSSSSVRSDNWRNSMSTTSSAATSTSAFTRYSNASARSVSTANTSISNSSWRSKQAGQNPPSSASSSSHDGAIPTRNAAPKNIKLLSGTPWELDQLPRQMHANPAQANFGSPPVRPKQRTRKNKDPKLDTITEKPQGGATSPPTTTNESTTELDGDLDADGQKKVQKGQINALAKMLSALRR